MNKTLKRIVTITLSLPLVVLAIYIIYYYVSFSQTSFASTEQDLTAMLPEGHPDITAIANQSFPAEGKNCLSCHKGIEPTRPIHSKMMQQIFALGAKMGDPNGCVVCHGGNPSETKNKDKAHHGVPEGGLLKAFTPVPAALQVNENTCGRCHKDHLYNVHRSIMNTDAGKIKAMTWSFGQDVENKDHIYGDHAMDDPDGPTPRFATEKYIAYMKDMAQKFPGQYPKQLKEIPHTELDKLASLPQQAAFNYLRRCNTCHISTKGYQSRGSYRGMGCAACHSLYSREGFYEGGDSIIDKTTRGHLLVHTMQGTRKSAQQINGKTVSGVQVYTCAVCHGSGRRIGVTYQGVMGGQFMGNDAHHRIMKNGKLVTGLLCQDCHTTNAMHGNGNIGSTTLATIEIECADCHGTPTHYPWELPLGFGDEFGKKLDMSLARGVAEEPLKVTKEFGTVYPKEDGYLLSSRGNPLGNVIRRGNKVIVHSDAGQDFEVPALKDLTEREAWQHPTKAKTAMVSVKKHMESMECYACHARWAPQYYGYRNTMNFSKQSIDWVASSNIVHPDGTTADYHGEYVMQQGTPGGGYQHTRSENPPLGINGEGRVSPLVGVIQTVFSVVDQDKKLLHEDIVARTPQGYKALEMATSNPHTTSLESRECAECHGSSMTIGYGTNEGVYDTLPRTLRLMDAVDLHGEGISKHSVEQISQIKDLGGEFMQILSAEGKQLLTVDSHWPTSMPLTAEQRSKLARKGTCSACHQDIPEGAIPIRMLGKIAEIADLDFATEEAHGKLLRQNNLLISWVKAGGIVLIIIFISVLLIARKKVVKKLSSIRKQLK